MSTHPYFTARARYVFANASGDPEVTGALAAWAEQAHAAGDGRPHGVVVAQDGTLVAETMHAQAPGRASATYITRMLLDLPGAGEVGLAMGALRRDLDQPVIHLTSSRLCSGRADSL